MKILAPFILAVLLIAGCGQTDTSDLQEPVTHPVTVEEESTTVRIVRSWTEPADSLAQVLGGEYVHLMDFINKKGHLSVLREDGDLLLLEENAPPVYEDPSRFIIVAFDEGGGELQEYGEGSKTVNVLEYFESDRMMVFYDVEFSPQWRALALFKIGHQAQLSISTNGVLDWLTFPHVTESLAYDWLFNALLKIGGEPYNDLVNTEAARIKKVLAESGKSLGEGVAMPEGIYKELSEIFVEPHSALELQFRHSILWFNANFRIIEEEHQEDEQLAAKARFLELIPYLASEGISI